MLKKLLVFTLLNLAALLAFAQQQSEEELIEQADELFAEEKFADAFPLYSQLVSLHPKSPIYNYKFGTCALYSGEDKSTAIRHLTFSTKKGVSNPQAWYYLGRAYHLNYQFDDAIETYRKFQQKADDKVEEDFDAEAQIERCEFGYNLLTGIKEIVVLEKVSATIEDYFRYYNLEEIGGKMLQTPEEVLSKLDKKKGYRSTIHYSGESGVIYFPSYGDEEETGTDIYRSYLLPDGDWSDPEKLKGFVNTNHDEDFAFFHPDGKTFYFASKGHNSMGGFDIFKSTYNESEDSFGPPENMDFAINTPDDDIFYVADKDKNTAYFASARNSTQGELHVYKVKVQSLPLNVVVIEGDFISEIDADQKVVAIRIVETNSGRVLDSFRSDESTGKYTIPLERSGNYTFEVETPNSPLIHAAKVRIPAFDESVSITQEMRLVKQDGVEKLIVNNQFTDPQSLDLADISLDFIRKKAGLDVNATDELLSRVENKTEQSADPAVQAGFTDGTTTSEVVENLKERQDEIVEESSIAEEKADALVALAVDRQGRADSLLSIAAKLRQQLDKDNPEKYLQQLAELNIQLTKAKELKKEAESALELSKESVAYAEDLNNESRELQSMIENLNNSLEQQNDDMLLMSLREAYKAQSNLEREKNPGAVAKQTIREEEAESQELLTQLNELRNDQQTAGKSLERQEELLSRASGKKEKEIISQKINQLEGEIEVLKSNIERKKIRAKEASVDAEKANIKEELYSSKTEDLSIPEEIRASFDRSQRNTVFADLQKTTQTIERLDFNDDESIALGSDEMRSTRNDIEVLQLIESRQEDSEIQLKAARDLRGTFRSIEADVERDESNPSQAQKQATDLKNEIESHIAYWEDQVESLDPEAKEVARKELEELRSLQSTLESKMDSGSLASSAESPNNSSGEEMQEETSNDEASAEPENTTETDDAGNIPESKEVSDENKGTSEEDTPSEVAGETSSDSGEQLQSEETGTLSETETNQVEDGDEELDFELEEIKADEVRSIASDLQKAESFTEYDQKSQELIKLDNEIKTATEEANTQDDRDSLLQIRSEIKNVQLALLPLDDLYREELSEIEKQNTSREAKNMQKLELNRKYIQLLDKKLFLLDSFSASEEETSFDRDFKRKEVENRKSVAEENVNGLRAELNTGEIAVLADPADGEPLSAHAESTPEEGSTPENEVEFPEKLPEEPMDILHSLILNFEARKQDVINSESEEMKASLAKGFHSETVQVINEALAERSEAMSDTDLATDRRKEIEDEINRLQLLKAEVEESSPQQFLEFGEAHVDDLAENDEPMTVDDNTGSSEEENISASSMELESETIPDRKTIDEAYETEEFREFYANHAGINYRFRNEQRLEKFRTELIELKQELEQAPENRKEKIQKKISKVEEKIAREEAENGSMVQGMIEKAYEQNSDLINTSKRIQDEPLSREQKTYRELLEASAEKNLQKADSLLSIALNEPDVEEQNRLLKEAYVYESRTLKRQQALIDLYENRTVNNDLVVYTGNEEKTADESSGDPDISSKDLTENIASEEAEDLAGIDEDPSEQPETQTSEDLVEEQPGDVENRNAEELAENSDDRNANDEDETSDSHENEEVTPDEMDANPIQDPAGEIEENLPEEAPALEEETEIESKRVVEARVVQREEMENEFARELNLSDGEMAELKTSPEYSDYSEQARQIRDEQQELKNNLSQLVSSRSDYNHLMERIAQLENEIAETTDENEKAEKEQELTRARVQAEVSYQELENAREEVKQQTIMLSAAIVEAKADWEELIKGVSARKAGNVGAANLTAQELARLEMPEQLHESLFARSEEAVYSDEQPIPVIDKMPDGVIYQVQVGAFRNPIPQDLFGGFAPVMAHKLDNGITRYTVGLFNGHESARNARNEVRELGYSDAFIVAYRNGERISVDQARSRESDPVADNADDNFETVENSSSASESTSGTEPETPEAEELEEAPARAVEDIDGVFYTVQVGVFSNPVSKSELYNISPLNKELTVTQKIRYTTGVFESIEAASQRKEEVRELGISDAFVSAYHNGERITIDRARELASGKADSSNEKPEEADVQYDVLIGSFNNQVPSDVAQAMLVLEQRYGIVQIEKDGQTIYSTEKVNSRLEAERIQAAFIEYDITNTQIREFPVE